MELCFLLGIFIMKNQILLFTLIILSLLLSELTIYLLNTNILIHNNLLNQYGYQEANSIFSKIRKWQLLTYIIVPTFLLLKTHLIAAILNIGCFIHDIKIKHKSLWNITLKAEFIFILSGVIKIFVLKFSDKTLELEEIHGYSPLSLSSILNLKQIPVWYHYPLQALNIFELFYITILITAFSKAFELKTAIKVVFISYLPAFLLWLVTLIFIYLNLS